MGADFVVQFVERVTNSREDVMPARCQSIHAHPVGSFRLGGAQPSSLSHSRQHRIQGTGAQPISVMMKLLEHPVSVDALFISMMQDVNFPERQKKFTDDRIAHFADYNDCAVVVDIP